MQHPLLIALFATLGAACKPIPASSGFKMVGDGRVPDKPGASITHTMMCSCVACEPQDCCHELEQDQPELQQCADGYDFSNCEMVVSSCRSSCFQHRWRARIEVGCAASQPDRCCHDQDAS